MAKQRTKTTQPSDINQTSPPAAKKPKPVRRSEEGLRARKESDRLRVKTRINISHSFTRWRKFKEEKNLRTDGDVADYLLNLQQEDLSTALPAADSIGTEEKTPSTAAQASTSVGSGFSVHSVLQWASALSSGPSTSSLAASLAVQGTGVDTTSPSPSLPIPVAPGAASTSPQSAPPAELRESFNAVTVDRLHQETESSSTAKSKSDENSEKALSQSKTIVNDSCLMELFKKCQTCGQPITKKKVSHCGAQKKVRWSCLGGHSGIWMSSPHLWEAFPEIHLLTTLSVLFSGGTFAHFKKWAKHLHLNFIGHKTFFEIQKAYLTPEMTPTTRTEQEGVFAKGVHQQPEDTLHMSDHLKKIKARSRRREKGALSPWSSYEKRSSVSLTSTGTCTQEPTALSSHRVDVEHQSETTAMVSEVDWLQDSFEEMEVTIDEEECNSVKNRLSDLDSDLENVGETTELSAPGGDDSDEDVYVPIIPQRSTSSELLLECEEEELEPWQQPTLHVHVKEEDDVGELSNDKTDFKPDPSLLQRNTGVIVASPELTSNSEFTGSLAAPSQAGSSFTLVPVKTEDDNDVHTSEVHQISDSSVSPSSPAVCTTSSMQLHSDHCNSRTLSVPFSLPCFTGTSNKE